MEIRNSFNGYAKIGVNNADSCSKLNSYSQNLYGNSFSKCTSSQSFKGTSYLKPIFEPISRFLRNSSYKKRAEKILDSYHEISANEYNAMSEEAKSILRNFCPCSEKDVHELVYLYQTMKFNLAKRFPNGFTFVSIGRSPAVLAKLLQSQGGDVRFCPLSEMTVKHFIAPADKHINEYAKYFEHFGLTKEAFESSDKPFVFVDHTEYGRSLANAETLLGLDGIGIRGENAVFLSLNKDLMQGVNQKRIDLLVKKWFSNSWKGKEYSPIPRAPYYDIPRRLTSIINYKPSNTSKIMQFHLIDTLERQKAMMNKSNIQANVSTAVSAKQYA